MRILIIGDIFGRPGRRALATLLPGLVHLHRVDCVIANAENAAGGRGLTADTAREIVGAGVQVMTSGNHIWTKGTIDVALEPFPLLRPVNTEEEKPGRGWLIQTVCGSPVAVISLQGRIFMEEKGPKVKSPFTAIDELLLQVREKTPLIIIDFHAEATSEKRCLAWYVDGRVSAVVGTHTHVQTADEEILPQGTAYISDLGMTGPHASVIGLDKDVAIHRFLTGDRRPFAVAEGGVRLEGVVVDVDERTGRARSILRLQERLNLE